MQPPVSNHVVVISAFVDTLLDDATSAAARLTLEVDSAANGSTILQTGTTAQRDGSPAVGYIRGNTTLTRLEWYNGSDWVDAGGGNDCVFGGFGDDAVVGGNGNDELHGEAGDDWLSGGHGNDYLFGGEGDDALTGGAGDDHIEGGDGHDWMIGNGGDDVILGGAGGGGLEGGAGDDTLNGGSGHDTLIGGEGADTFVFSKNSGFDEINDFDQYAGDRMDISALHVDPADLHIAQDGADTLITFSNDANVLLIGVDADSITSDSFTH